MRGEKEKRLRVATKTESGDEDKESSASPSAERVIFPGGQLSVWLPWSSPPRINSASYVSEFEGHRQPAPGPTRSEHGRGRQPRQMTRIGDEVRPSSYVKEASGGHAFADIPTPQHPPHRRPFLLLLYSTTRIHV